MTRSYTYKFRLYPTPAQQQLLAKHFGCVRWVYNHFLDNRTKHYLNAKEKELAKKSLNYFDDAAILTSLKKQPDTAWLAEVNAQSLQQTLKHLDGAFNRFYKKLGKFPRFKKKNSKNSFRVPQRVQIFGGKLVVPKFVDGIRMVVHRHIEGIIKNATITRTASGRYFVMIGVERDIKPKKPIDTAVGVDLGVKSLAVTSDGTIYPNIKPFRSRESRMRLLSKAYARTVAGSHGREKARHKLAKLHSKIANIRSNHLHSISRRLVDENQIIVLEDLNLSGMMSNRKLSKSIWDCSLYELIRQIKYKADWAGRQVVQIDRWFPSSKTCGKCSYVIDNLTLADRSWVCPRCGVTHDRDLNAANNILVQGLNLLNKRLTDTPMLDTIVDSVKKPQELRG